MRHFCFQPSTHRWYQNLLFFFSSFNDGYAKKRSSIYASFQQFPFFNPVFYLVKSYPVYSGILNGMVINSHNIFLIVNDSVMRYLLGSRLVPLFAAHFYSWDFAAILQNYLFL